MAVSRFIEVTDEEINCFNENVYFSNNHLCNYTRTIIHLRLGEKKNLDFVSAFQYSPIFAINYLEPLQAVPLTYVSMAMTASKTVDDNNINSRVF